MIKAGNIIEGYEMLEELNGYKDSKEKSLSLFGDYIATAKTAGSTVTFGAYEQDNDISNGKESIEWRILNIQSDGVTLISEYALDCQPYNTTDENTTWESCSLRAWLNSTFINEAFTAEEQALIGDTNVEFGEINTLSVIPPSGTTRDKAFIISLSEFWKASKNGILNKICTPTAYAVAQGGLLDYGSTYWWLRNQGKDQNKEVCVQPSGQEYAGYTVNQKYICVRPCIFIKRSQDEQTNQDISINETLLEGLGQLTYGDIVAKYGQPKSRGEYFSGGRYIDFENDIIDSRVFSGDLAYDEMPKNSAVWTGAFSTAKDIFNGLSGTIKMSELSEKLGIDLEYCPESGEGSDITFVYKSIRFCIINQEDFIGEPYISPDDFVNFF